MAAAATCIQHMQKALTEMNIQLANVISDISGTTGLAILSDIVRGERDPYKLAMHKHSRIRASRQEIASQPGRNLAEGAFIRSRTKPGSLPDTMRNNQVNALAAC